MLSWLAAPALVAASALAAPAACGDGATASLLAMDTASGAALFALGAASGPAQLLSFQPEEPSSPATLSLVEDTGRHFAGSIGPGPMFALRRCGAGCVSAEAWEGGFWQPLASPLGLADEANLYTTRDRGGAAWIVAHRPAAAVGWITAQAFNLVAGEWRGRGSLNVRAIPTQGLLPDPVSNEAVITGTGRFSRSQAPNTWSSGIPTLPAGKHGQLLPFGGTAAAYLAADGAIYFSADLGATWKGLRFKPWGVEPTEIWNYGLDYSADLPLGAWGDALPLAWFDRRPGRDARIFLTELSTTADWQLLSELAPEVETGAGKREELVHLLRTAGGTWALLTDCYLDEAGGPTVALRSGTPGALGPLRFLRVTAQTPKSAD